VRGGDGAPRAKRRVQTPARHGSSGALLRGDENILSEGRGQVSVTSLAATNVFEQRRGEWLMMHHHASHVLASEPPESE